MSEPSPSIFSVSSFWCEDDSSDGNASNDEAIAGQADPERATGGRVASSFASCTTTDSDDDSVDADSSAELPSPSASRSSIGTLRQYRTSQSLMILRPRWVCHTCIVGLWFWSTAFHLLADWLRTEEVAAEWVCACQVLARMPYTIASSWMAWIIGGFDAWFLPAWMCIGSASAFVSCRIFLLRGPMEGTLASGAVDTLCGCVLLFTCKTRRASMAVAVAVWFGVLHGLCRSLAVTSYCFNTTALLVTFRAFMPAYEVFTRKLFVLLWKCFRKDCPELVLVNVIVANVLIVEVFQLASFAAAARAEDPLRGALSLVIVSIISDVLARSKLVQMMAAAMWSQPYKMKLAAELALRARWWYIYLLLPPILLLLLGWHICIRPVPADVFLCVTLYFISEVLSDVVFLLWQHSLRLARGGKVSIFDTLEQVRQRNGHLVPQLCISKKPQGGGRPPAMSNEDSEAQTPAPVHDFCGLCPKTMSGAFLASLSSYWIYWIFTGIYMPLYCTSSLPWEL